MKIFRFCYGMKGADETIKLAPVLKYEEAALFLGTQLKFMNVVI